MKLRSITVAAVAVLALAGLSACDSNAGTAAVVDGHRISQTDVEQYVQTNAQPFQSQTGEVVPRSLVLNTLIAKHLYAKALRENGGMPSAVTVNKAKKTLLQGTDETKLVSNIVESGFTESFEPVYLRTQALEHVLEQRVQKGLSAKKVTASLNAHVTVNSSYGTWGENGLSNDPTTGQPPFVVFNSAAKAAAG